jgi:hypothetical protein
MTSDSAHTPFPAPESRPGSGSSPGPPSPDEDLAFRLAFLAYLTAALPQAEAESFELRLLEDNHFAQQIDLVEQELLEEYAAGTLAQSLALGLPDTSTQSSVEAQIGTWIEASPARREHVRLTRLLLDREAARQLQSSAHPANPAAPGKPQLPRKTQTWLWLGAASAACLLLGVMLPGIRHTHPAPATRTTATIPNASGPALASPSADVILLAAERLRGTEPAKSAAYTLHPDAPIRLQILLPPASAASAYTLSVRPANSRTALARFTGLAVRRESGTLYLEATLAPGALKPGAYVVTVASPGAAIDLPLRVVFP